MPRLVEIRLLKVHIKKNGYVEGGTNVLGFTLIYPREGVPAVATTRTARLSDGKDYDFAADREKKDRSFETLLLKETIRGDCPLIVEVGAVARPDWFAGLLLKSLSAVIGAGLRALPVGGAITTILSSSAGSLFEQLAPKEQTYVIGRGLLPLSENMKSGERHIPLTVPVAITLWKAAPPATSIGTAPPRDEELRLEQNEPNGEVVVAVRSSAV